MNRFIYHTCLFVYMANVQLYSVRNDHYDDNDNGFIFQFAQVAYEHNLQIYIMNNIDNGIIQIGGRGISMYSCGLTCPSGNFKYINYICCELKIVTNNIKFCIFGLDTV